MGKIDCFDLTKVKGALDDNPESDIFIISGNLKSAKLYEERIREHVKTKRRIRTISNSVYSMDGLNFIDSIVFLCGYWWQNKNAITFIKHFSKLPRLVIPITNIPSMKGGDE
ncbi:hypothetical protein [Thermaerobacillus caldiproteolyticus]|uniref:Uncharacterized protein n=1 Tax=Thermaerobacillus caldiproteolyticus TaxID=247480 RepID=A0A7W0BZC3_9BACL|nr:hypothetical protein [Anoxybacillus caldiproteolyticus]MBA2874316.1 hypothetical protein [Anoxybacillus caldiproteolyticus]